MELIKNFIDGEFVEGVKTFEKRSPLDNKPLVLVSEAGKAQVDAAVVAARRALTGPWSTLKVAERIDLIYAVANEIARRFDQFLEAECADTGKPMNLARLIDIPRASINLKTFADMLRNMPTELFEQETPDGRGALNYAVRSPVGVIAAICPWNFPLLVTTLKVAPALTCGNTVIVKPSEETPQTTTLLAEVMKHVGIPNGVFNVVHGFGPDSTGEFLTTHPGVNAITFTGETRTGAAIMKAAAVGARA